MKNRFTFAILVLLLFSCSNEKEELTTDIKEGFGTVWLSGGLYFCAEQIRMDEGDTLIVVNAAELYKYTSGDHVKLKYRETGNKESGCNIGVECEILEIKKTD